MITTLPERLRALPVDLQAAGSIFDVHVTFGRTEPPPSMEPWINRQFGTLEGVRQQTVVSVRNRLTLESVLFNPLRARRPAVGRVDDTALEARIAQELADDIFADPLRDTPADLFGRIRGEHCVTASNVAKYDGWHGLVIFDNPHPLRFSREEVRDYLETARRWLAAAHACDPRAIYPLIMWNCLPKSGATLMHGHMQIALGSGFHYAHPESWRRAAHAYRSATARDYFTDLVDLHTALDLALPAPEGVRAFVHLTPLRNREVVLLASPVGEPARQDEGGAEVAGALPYLPVALADAIYDILRALIDGQCVRAFNLVIALPPIGTADEDWDHFPIVVRLGDRGAPLTDRNDVGAMELYATGCITADPFDVAAALRERL